MNPNLPTGETMSDGDFNMEAEVTAAPSAIDTVPVAALSMPDESEQMTPPEVGDEVTYQVTGKVTAINGEIATIERTSVNGQEIGSAEPDADDEQGLMEEAQRLDA